MVFSFIKKEHISNKMGSLAVIRFVTTMAAAMIGTIWALYLDSFFNSIILVGFFSAALALLSFLSYFIFVPIVEKINKSKIYSFSLLVFSITYFLFGINSNLYYFVILAFSLTIIGTLKVMSFGIMVNNESSKKLLSQNEGLIYVFANVAWLIGPLIAGFIASKYNLNVIFFLGAIFTLISFFLFKFTKLKESNISSKIHLNPIKTFFEFFKNKDRVIAYILRGGVNLWFSLVYIFMPLYIIRNNLSELWIGYFLAATVIPLILFEFYFSKLAGKIGFKKIFKMGFLIVSILTVICFFVSNIYLILLILVIANIGIAMIEPTTEAYFFDLLKGKQALQFYGPYNTTVDVNNFVVKIAASSLLIFLPFRFIFLLFGGFMFIYFLICFKMKDVIEAKK